MTQSQMTTLIALGLKCESKTQDPMHLLMCTLILSKTHNLQNFIQLISCFHLHDNKGSGAKEQDLVGAPWKITGVPEYESWQLGINEPPGNDGVL